MIATLLLGALAWLLTGLALGIPIGRAIARADAELAAEAAAAMSRHPSAQHLSEYEVQCRIRDMERRWIA